MHVPLFIVYVAISQQERFQLGVFNDGYFNFLPVRRTGVLLVVNKNKYMFAAHFFVLITSTKLCYNAMKNPHEENAI